MLGASTPSRALRLALAPSQQASSVPHSLTHALDLTTYPQTAFRRPGLRREETLTGDGGDAPQRSPGRLEPSASAAGALGGRQPLHRRHSSPSACLPALGAMDNFADEFDDLELRRQARGVSRAGGRAAGATPTLLATPGRSRLNPRALSSILATHQFVWGRRRAARRPPANHRPPGDNDRPSAADRCAAFHLAAPAGQGQAPRAQPLL